MAIDEAAVGAAVWRQCWQVTLLIAVMAIVARSSCRNRPQLGHLLWMIVIVKCLTPPLWSSPTSAFSWAFRLETSSPTELPITRISSADNDNHANQRKHTPPSEEDGALQTDPTRLATNPNDDNAEFAIASPSAWSKSGWLLRLAAAWLTGAGFLAAIVIAKWLICWRILKSCAQSASPELSALTSRLSTRLGLRRHVRLIVVERHWGPATYGVWRPTIILPAELLRAGSKINVELLLAHELVHVRRGDFVCALLQLAAQLVWWFHPLVWWVNRRIRIARERCCDEEVVAGLRCRPADYAGSLLALLQWKVSLRFVPGFPAARAADVTSDRLEEIIMRAGKFKTRAPRWCWTVAIVVAMTVLPGAALTYGESQEKAPGAGQSAEAAQSADATREATRPPAANLANHESLEVWSSLLVPQGGADFEELERIADLARRQVDSRLALIQTQYNRLAAGREEVETLSAKLSDGRLSVNRLLEAQRRLAQSKSDYARAVIELARLTGEPTAPPTVFEYQIALEGAGQAKSALQSVSERALKGRGDGQIPDHLNEQIAQAREQYWFFKSAAKTSLQKLHELERVASETASQ